MTAELKDFIENSIDLIESNNFVEVYEDLAYDLSPGYGTQEQMIGEFTTCMLEADIDPLPHMPYIPTAYLYGQNVSYFGIPNHVDNIGNFAFQESDLEEIIIPSNVKVIGIKAFCTCESLTSVTIEDGCTIIGDYAFMYCEQLEEIYIPKSVTTIMNDVFYGCDKLVIHCEEDSAAAKYADDYGIDVEYV